MEVKNAITEKEESKKYFKKLAKHLENKRHVCSYEIDIFSELNLLQNFLKSNEDYIKIKGAFSKMYSF